MLSLGPDAKAQPGLFLTLPIPAFLPGCEVDLPQPLLLLHGVSGQFEDMVSASPRQLLGLFWTPWGVSPAGLLKTVESLEREGVSNLLHLHTGQQFEGLCMRAC